ncbi:type II secretion system protein [Bacillus sp. Marseille-Q3570]|uniref:type II secretion system protein n=1 Tax=Bacillus sp. Marseille-Q3570 TaxID=2963522 RepID=UPI0021B7B146|nr:hypothetical protein [Bacillus sp. Marseille-Q3570]
MLRNLKSNNGSTLVIVLMVIMVLGILIPAGFNWYNKLFMNENRILQQKQAVNLSVSAMETFKLQDSLDKIDYLKTYTYTLENPLHVMKDGMHKLHLYQYAEDSEGNRLTSEQLENYSGEYTVVTRAIAGDLNQDQQKNADEPYFYEHRMTAVEKVANGEVLIEKLNGETLWMSFQEFIQNFDNVTIKGDVTVFSVGENHVYDETNKMTIITEGNLSIKGGNTINTNHNGQSEISLISNAGNITIDQTELISTGNSNHSFILLNAPYGNVSILESTIKAERYIYIYAGMDKGTDEIKALDKDILIHNSIIYVNKNKSDIIKKASGQVVED